MAAKLIVMYPAPKGATEFERAYTEDHVPMVTSDAMPGLKKFVQLKVVGTPDGNVPSFARIAELHFDSIGELLAAAGGEAAAKAVAHAHEISTGGAPVILVCESASTTF